jgi:hypothetical protein
MWGQTGVCQTNRIVPPISANAEQIAKALDILPLVERGRALAAECGAAGVISAEELALRQQITESVTIASLDVDGVLAEIDYERAEVSELKDRLSAARDRKVNVLTVGSIIVGTGSGVVGTAMQFSTPLAKAGDWISAVGGASGVVLSILALRQPGREGTLGVAPNMLAPVFGRGVEVRSRYPNDVWTFLNTAPATDPRVHIPWKDQLIDAWVKLGRIGPPDAAASQAKIDKVTSRISDHAKLSIDDLTDRNAMLMDLRSRLALMNRDLRDLLRSIHIAPAQ